VIITASRAHPARGLRVISPKVIINDAGSTAMANIPRKLVSGVGLA
jgi:hypothetical protein